MFVRPASKDLIVRHPDTGRPLPPTGGELPDQYALRRLRDGSVVRVSEPVRDASPPDTESKSRPRNTRIGDTKGEAD